MEKSYLCLFKANLEFGFSLSGRRQEVEGFLNNKEILLPGECEKCAYVIPVYEVKSTIGRDVMPVNKTELMYLVERYYARRFHQTVYLLNQLSSDLDRKRENETSNSLAACL